MSQLNLPQMTRTGHRNLKLWRNRLPPKLQITEIIFLGAVEKLTKQTVCKHFNIAQLKYYQDIKI